ncbi:MAG TPA: 16S rRNA (cytosine(1402)-N(4))-methyltransferase RsmH [candidate division Zixibacteria bacterium]
MVHIPVLLSEVTEYLIVDRSGIYVDATVGEGGHAYAILSGLDQRGKLICTDRDEQAIRKAKSNLAEFGKQVVFQKLYFSQLEDFLKELKIDNLSGVLFDLGISSAQIENVHRGFSYLSDGPLDMRMDQAQSKTAADVVNSYDPKELARIFFELGEERFSRRIASAIVRARKKREIRTTGHLREIIENKVNPKHKIKSLARIFQALRIEINQELEELKRGLKTAVDFLKPEGRVCVITYHSLEDRIVKNQFRRLSQTCNCPPYFPICRCGQKQVLRVLTKKPIVPSLEEIKANPKSRSAKLRVAAKLG